MSSLAEQAAAARSQLSFWPLASGGGLEQLSPGCTCASEQVFSGRLRGCFFLLQESDMKRHNFTTLRFTVRPQALHTHSVTLTLDAQSTADSRDKLHKSHYILWIQISISSTLI